MEVERFSKVMHIVSTVEGDLRPDMEPLRRARGDVPGRDRHRRAEAPGDGADRRSRADAARGPYAGAVGYLTFAGDLDFCITIRTAVVANDGVSIQAGAGVVADSDPETELRETRAKAEALLSGGRPDRWRRIA